MPMLASRENPRRGANPPAPAGSLTGPHGQAGTVACSPELFLGNVEVAVSKRKPLSEGRQAAEGESDDAWRRRADTKLVGLFHAALEEPIPDDMMRLVRMIGGQHSQKSEA